MPDKSKWKVVEESSKAQFGIVSALQEFSKDLERAMGRMSDVGGKSEIVRSEIGKTMGKRERAGLFGEEDYELAEMMGDWKKRRGGGAGAGAGAEGGEDDMEYL